jgi:chloramphenicol-sensitive protein RarD
MLWLLGSTTMIALNWLVFIWAVGKGYVLEASLGYFINPLVNVLLGFLFLRERLRPWQVVGVLLAAAGVLNLTIHQGQVPWIALALAATFGLYGLLRKTAQVGPLVGLTVETSLLLPIGLYFAATGVWRDWAGAGTLGFHEYKWLPLSGVVTAVPLLWFAAAAKRLRLSTLGFLQYVSPTCQFLLAIFAYGERFTPVHLASFCCIWAALLIYSADSLRGYWITQNRQEETSAKPCAAQRQ